MYIRKFYNLVRLMRINQPIGIFLLLWPTLWGLWISNKGIPDFDILILFILGVVLMRSAGCVINDYIDCNIDGCVKRTKYRPLVDGTVTKKEAFIIFFILIIIALKLVLIFNIKTVLLALTALILTCIYPYLKRYIFFPQLVLGILFSWPILMTFTATNHVINSTTWLLFIMNTLWAISYDTQYAMVDRDDDQCIQVKSSAIFFGKMDKLIIGILQSISLLILSMIGWKEQFSIVFYTFSVFGVLILFIWQQVLIYSRSQLGCSKSFLNNNYVGLLILVGIVLNFY